MPKKLKKKYKDDHDTDTDYHKHKRMKRKKSSSDRSSTSPEPSSSSMMRVIKDLEQRRLEEQLERKKMKNEIKMKETPEEKRARRLLEKKAKELRRRERMGWDTEYQHYTNQDNPFGDSNLMSTFVWNKKLEKEGLTNVSAETVEILSRQKQLENKVELEKVKKRRIERESERQAREDEMVLLQRSKEAAQFKEWERQEDQFHLEQARLRSVIRIQDGRAKPIDLLAQYISCSKLEDSIEMQMHEPYILLNGLNTKDLEDLLVDIKVYVELEKGCNIEFWDDMTLIVEDELLKKKKLETIESCILAGGRRQGINESVARDVSDIFRGKNTVQLNELGNRIEQKINARNDGVDISYWESLLSQLKAHMARARLRDHHQANLQQKLKMLKTMSISEDPSYSDTASHFSQSMKRKLEAKDPETAVDNKESDSATSNIDGSFRLYDESGYSPRYFEPSDLDEFVKIINENQDEQYLDRLRAQFIDKMHEESSVSHEELEMQHEAKKGMLADEAEFSVEAPIDTTLQLVSDKYRPRKPRYFNRVHTGFEWNKYNQTHYDMDNPPPKIVQGYKFNIFYPDLINKSATPQYILTQCSDNSDFAILRFHAGPPYEDIAFKIVNREWEFSYKRGFRCQFHNNIFQLWFHFKRYRYRR